MDLRQGAVCEYICVLSECLPMVGTAEGAPDNQKENDQPMRVSQPSPQPLQGLLRVPINRVAMWQGLRRACAQQHGLPLNEAALAPTALRV